MSCQMLHRGFVKEVHANLPKLLPVMVLLLIPDLLHVLLLLPMPLVLSSSWMKDVNCAVSNQGHVSTTNHTCYNHAVGSVDTRRFVSLI